MPGSPAGNGQGLQVIYIMSARMVKLTGQTQIAAHENSPNMFGVYFVYAVTHHG